MRTHCEPGCFTKTLAEIPLPRALARSVEDDLPKESNEGSTLNHAGTVGWESPRPQLEYSMTQKIAGKRLLGSASEECLRVYLGPKFEVTTGARLPY